jgi:hypothetical protein
LYDMVGRPLTVLVVEFDGGEVLGMAGVVVVEHVSFGLSRIALITS